MKIYIFLQIHFIRDNNKKNTYVSKARESVRY